MSKVSITRSLLDDLATSISAKSGEALPLTLDEMKDAVDGIQTGSGGSGDGYVWQDQDGYVHLSDEEGTQTTIDALTINASGTYTAPTGHAYSPVTVPSGTEGTPTTTKGTVSNHSISVTPSVTNTAGYITGSTKTGTAVTVSASELVSGTKSISANGTSIDVTNFASVDVAVPTGSATLITKSITANGTYNASSDNADGYSSVTVNVSGGGGTSSWTLLASEDITANIDSTTQTTLTDISCGSSAWTKTKIIYVRIRDKAGKRAGYFYGSDVFFINSNAANESTGNFTAGGRIMLTYSTSSTWSLASGTGYGVWAQVLRSSGSIGIYAKYSSSSLTINGTYKCEVYALDYPDGVSPFDA